MNDLEQQDQPGFGERPGLREFWLRPWTETQPDGFLSGNVTTDTSYDVHEEQTENCIHVREVLPGSITITLEQFREIFNKYDDKTRGQNPPEYSLIRELFGE